MKLITETTDTVRSIVEETDEGGSKNHYIEGIFMQAERKNRNGRVYPQKILADEVNRYNKEFVAKNRAMGELNHPDGPTVNLDRVSHIIKELKTDGNDIVGKAKILDTPMGKIAKNLIDEGAKLGVSSRGMGSLEERKGVNYVKDDFLLSAVDLVADPSAPGAFVNGIMEGKEWIWDNGIIREKRIEEYKHIIEKASRHELEEKALNVFNNFMSSI
tara:strand:- start:315 stop:962 length:648 start_codon:yes stop_codon:yes gene_type:complete